MKYSRLEKLLALELYDKTGNIDYIKNITGISKKTISTWIKDAGLSPETVQRTEKYIISKKIHDDIYEGYSMSAIMKKRNMTRLEVVNLMDYYIRTSLDKLNSNIREINENKRREETEEMISRLESGKITVTQLAKEQNVTVSAISKRISRHKIKWGNLNEKSI